MKLREMAELWANSNLLRADARGNLLQNVDLALKEQVTCSFKVGSKLTRSKRPFLVYGFRAEFFVFELSPGQTARVGIRDNQLVCATSRRRDPVKPRLAPRAFLNAVTVDSASSLDRTAPIIGTVEYHAEQHWFQPLALHVVCEPSGGRSISLFHHLHGLNQGDGQLQFSVRPLGELKNRDGKSCVGLVPLFFQIWTAAELQGKPMAVPGIPELHPLAVQPSRSTTRNRLPIADQALSLGAAPTSAPEQERDYPISDIRAVLVDVA